MIVIGLEITALHGLLVTFILYILVDDGVTVNELPLTVVQVEPLSALISYTVDEIVLVYEAVKVELLPAQIVFVPAKVTVGTGMAVIVIVLLT